MKTLDEVITSLDVCINGKGCKNCPYAVYDEDEFEEYTECEKQRVDALHYLKEYRKQKYIWKKLYLLAHQMFWGLEEEYPLDGERIANDLFDAYSEGFEDEDA